MIETVQSSVLNIQSMYSFFFNESKRKNILNKLIFKNFLKLKMLYKHFLIHNTYYANFRYSETQNELHVCTKFKIILKC